MYSIFKSVFFFKLKVLKLLYFTIYKVLIYIRYAICIVAIKEFKFNIFQSAVKCENDDKIIYDCVYKTCSIKHNV